MKDSKSNDLTIWEEIKEANPNHKDEVRRILSASGLTKGEIASLMGSKEKAHQKEDFRKIEQLKEDLYIRHQLRIRLLFEHIRDHNLLETLKEQREEEAHIIESLTKLGEIAPISTKGTSDTFSIKIEPYILQSLKEEDLPILPAIDVNEPEQQQYS